MTLIDPIVVAALCIGVTAAAPTRVRAAISRARDTLLRIPASLLIGVVAVVIIGAGVAIARDVYGGQPALTDELAQAFHGRILMAGRLVAIPEPHPEFFETSQTITTDGRWYSEYPIGSPIIAAVAGWTKLGVLINPILLALSAIAVWAFARRAYDEATARLALILVAVSPFAVFMTATRMNHVPVLALTAGALAALAQWTECTSRRSSAIWAGAIGATVGGIAIIRPYDAVLVALPIGVFMLFAISRRRELAASLIALIIAGGALTALQLWVNARTTGSATLFAYDALHGPNHRPGFHVDPLGLPFTPSRGLDYVMLYLQRLNTSLFESAIPALVFIVVALWITRPTRWDWLLAGIMLSMTAGYGFYWHQGSFNGPRFLYPALVAFVIFSARFIVLATRRGGRDWTGAALMIPLCVALAFVPSRIGNRSTGIWLRLSQMRAAAIGQDIDPAAEVRAAGIHNALVFVRESLHDRLAARLRALGMAPFDAERAAADLDACGLVAGLDQADAHPEVAVADRLSFVIAQGRTRGPVTPACRDDVRETFFYPRFLAASTIDSTGKLGGDVVFARWLGARDSALLNSRFAGRDWYLYHRGGQLERIR